MNLKIIIVSLIITTILWGWLVLKLIDYSMPYNSLSSEYISQKKILFRGIFPEGFSFFTRNPREPHTLIYHADSKEDILYKNKGYLNSFFGLNRYSRSVLIELGTLINVIDDKAWLNCKTNNCFNQEIPIQYLKNSYINPTLCGDYYLKFVEPTPWAWAKSFKEKNKKMPFKLTKISITCE